MEPLAPEVEERPLMGVILFRQFFGYAERCGFPVWPWYKFCGEVACAPYSALPQTGGHEDPPCGLMKIRLSTLASMVIDYRVTDAATLAGIRSGDVIQATVVRNEAYWVEDMGCPGKR